MPIWEDFCVTKAAGGGVMSRQEKAQDRGTRKAVWSR